MEIVFLLSAAPYPVSGEEAHALEGVIRRECVDLHGQPHDDNARACLQLAEVLAEDLEAGHREEPIELGRSHAVGLTE